MLIVTNLYFFPFSIKTSGSCNNVNNVKNLNVRVFNLMSRTNETKHIEWHDTCKCKCRLDGCVHKIKKVGTKINANMNAKN